MLGAICGDVIGSPYEFNATKDKGFELLTPLSRYTDDTVCTCAVAESLMSGRDVAETTAEFVIEWMAAGYGMDFLQWALDCRDKGMQPAYGSWGNGSAMRVSPVAWHAPSLSEVPRMAHATAEFTHSHREGVRGAEATAVAVRLALEGFPKDEIKSVIEEVYLYDLSRPVEEIRPGYMFEVACHFSVPEAITCFLESDGWEDAVRNAVSLGGDADTQACIAGAIAEAHYGGVPEPIFEQAMLLVDPRLAEIATRFAKLHAGAGFGGGDPAKLDRWETPPPGKRLERPVTGDPEAELARFMTMVDEYAPKRRRGPLSWLLSKLRG